MKRLHPLLLSLALAGQAQADDLMDNADLAPGNDLGEPVIIRLLPVEELDREFLQPIDTLALGRGESLDVGDAESLRHRMINKPHYCYCRNP